MICCISLKYLKRPIFNFFSCLSFIYIFAAIVTGNDDPCEISKRLPSFELRLKVFKINPITDSALCDRYLIEEPGEWFRSENENEMVNVTTDLYECGTEYGIYMIGEFSA